MGSSRAQSGLGSSLRGSSHSCVKAHWSLPRPVGNHRENTSPWWLVPLSVCKGTSHGSFWRNSFLLLQQLFQMVRLPALPGSHPSQGAQKSVSPLTEEIGVLPTGSISSTSKNLQAFPPWHQRALLSPSQGYPTPHPLLPSPHHCAPTWADSHSVSNCTFQSLLFSHSAVSNSVTPRTAARLASLSLTDPGACSNSSPLSR